MTAAADSARDESLVSHMPSAERELYDELIASAAARGDVWAVAHWTAKRASIETYYAEYARLVAGLGAAA